MERDPRVAFERLFGDGATPEQRLSRRQANASILDGIMGKVAELKKGSWPERSESSWATTWDDVS